MQKFLPKINVLTVNSTESSAEIAQSPAQNQQGLKKPNLITPRRRSVQKNSISAAPDDLHTKTTTHFREHVEDLSNNVLKNLKHLSGHVDDINRPFEKYYDDHGLKTKKGIRLTLNTNYEFYQEESGRSDMQKAMTLNTPFLTQPRSSTSSSQRKFFSKDGSKKFLGTKLLDTPLIPEPLSTVRISLNPRKLEVKARLKTELEENFERKFSNATALPISHRTITTALDSDRRSPRDQHHRLQTEGAVSNTPESFNTSNMSLMASRLKRKEIINEIANKNCVNYDKINSILQTNESYDANFSTQLQTTVTPKNELTQKKKVILKKFDNHVGYQILALDSKMRQKVKDRLKSVLPQSTKYKEYFLRP